MKILIASHNKGKIEEFRRILEPLNIEVITPENLGIAVNIEETGTTFAENSRQKAIYLYNKTGIATLADDSGLAIDALDGRPGVYTARYGGENIGYPEKFQLIFNELEGTEKENRTARFVCSICCVLRDNDLIEVSENCEGYIGFEPKGNDGFGFDPIFYVGDNSFAQLGAKEKDKISHRGKAIVKFINEFKNRINEDIL